MPLPQLDLEKWKVPICVRTPSWGQEDRIGTLSSDVIQLLHRYCLIISSQDPGDGFRLKEIHRKRQVGTLADFRCIKTKGSSILKIKSARRGE